MKHQTRWQVTRSPDGSTRWTAPTGRNYTQPPPDPLPVDTELVVRPVKAEQMVPWMEVAVRSCRPSPDRLGYELGCCFVKSPKLTGRLTRPSSTGVAEGTHLLETEKPSDPRNRDVVVL